MNSCRMQGLCRVSVIEAAERMLRHANERDVDDKGPGFTSMSPDRISSRCKTMDAL